MNLNNSFGGEQKERNKITLLASYITLIKKKKQTNVLIKSAKNEIFRNYFLNKRWYCLKGNCIMYAHLISSELVNKHDKCVFIFIYVKNSNREYDISQF